MREKTKYKLMMFSYDTQCFPEEVYKKERDKYIELERQEIGRILQRDTKFEYYEFNDIEIKVPANKDFKDIILGIAKDIATIYGFPTIDLWLKYPETNELYNSGVCLNIVNNEISEFHTNKGEWDFLKDIKK